MYGDPFEQPPKMISLMICVLQRCKNKREHLFQPVKCHEKAFESEGWWIIDSLCFHDFYLCSEWPLLLSHSSVININNNHLANLWTVSAIQVKGTLSRSIALRVSIWTLQILSLEWDKPVTTEPLAIRMSRPFAANRLLTGSWWSGAKQTYFGLIGASSNSNAR